MLNSISCSRALGFRFMPLVNLTKNNAAISSVMINRTISSTSVCNTFKHKSGESKKEFPTPKRWAKYNEIILEPEDPNSLTRRRATYHYVRDNVKCSQKKMFYICSLIRGMTVDEAIKQLSFIPAKVAQQAKEMLIEAQEQALNYGFEYRSEMFVGECFTGRGLMLKTSRKHAYYREGRVMHTYVHFFLKLVEGPVPEVFYPEMNPSTGKGKLQKYLDELKERKIEHTI